jgi:hypothetical protein
VSVPMPVTYNGPVQITGRNSNSTSLLKNYPNILYTSKLGSIGKCDFPSIPMGFVFLQASIIKILETLTGGGTNEK